MRGPGLSAVVKTVSRFLAPFVLLYGLYLIAYGHLTPGGGFPGGVMIAGGFMMLVLALGRAEGERALPRPVAGMLDSVGALAFLVLAALGLWLGGSFFLNFMQKSSPGDAHEVFNAGIVPLANVAIALKVSACFAAVFVILAACRVSAGGKYESDEEE
jgi:multicomponent Na+:H+ antiporter subunit B